jgi:hypothetical protein
MLVTDVMRAEPSEWSELLVVVEFAVYNTPLTDTGITPRDLDRRWSLATPLVQRLFTTYRELHSRVSTAVFAAREKRAGLVNRFRRSRKIEVGMKVAYRDPRITHTSGRTPWRKPLSGPFEVVGVQGTKITLTDGGKDRHEVHAEDVVILPAVVEPLEGKEALRFDQDQEEGRRSPGEMAEADPAPAFGTGKLSRMAVRQHIAYSVGNARLCRIGRIVSLQHASGTVTVHRHGAISDGRLRVIWKPVMIDAEGQEVLGSAGEGEKAALDRS